MKEYVKGMLLFCQSLVAVLGAKTQTHLSPSGQGHLVFMISVQAVGVGFVLKSIQTGYINGINIGQIFQMLEKK